MISVLACANTPTLPSKQLIQILTDKPQVNCYAITFFIAESAVLCWGIGRFGSWCSADQEVQSWKGSFA